MELPRGMRDIESNELAGINFVREKFFATARLFNFRMMEPSPLEMLATLEAKSGASISNEIYAFKDTPFDYAFNAVVHARKTLEAGFTSVRDVGSPPFLAVDLRNYINEGFIPGPRVVASGPPISITGGHGEMDN